MYWVDLHCDTASLLYQKGTKLDKNTHQIDLKKLKEANYAAQWFAYFIDTKALKGASPLTVVKEMDLYFKKELMKHKETITLARNYEEYCSAKKEGKIAAFLSIEEGQIIEGKLENIDALYQMGIRMMTLTWNYANQLAFPHTSSKGLLPLGKEVLSYLNERSILLDISHLSPQAVKESLSFYKKPVIASHCNAQGVHFHTRNLSDESIACVAKSGGLIGINFYSYFLNGTNKSTIESILKHIDYFYQKAGADCVTFGTDFDGMGDEIHLEVCNAKEMDKLLTRLCKKYKEDQVEKFCYKNHERLLKDVF